MSRNLAIPLKARRQKRLFLSKNSKRGRLRQVPDQSAAPLPQPRWTFHPRRPSRTRSTCPRSCSWARDPPTSPRGSWTPRPCQPLATCTPSSARFDILFWIWRKFSNGNGSKIYLQLWGRGDYLYYVRPGPRILVLSIEQITMHSASSYLNFSACGTHHI